MRDVVFVCAFIRQAVPVHLVRSHARHQGNCVIQLFLFERSHRQRKRLFRVHFFGDAIGDGHRIRNGNRLFTRQRTINLSMVTIERQVLRIARGHGDFLEIAILEDAGLLQRRRRGHLQVVGHVGKIGLLVLVNKVPDQIFVLVLQIALRLRGINGGLFALRQHKADAGIRSYQRHINGNGVALFVKNWLAQMRVGVLLINVAYIHAFAIVEQVIRKRGIKRHLVFAVRAAVERGFAHILAVNVDVFKGNQLTCVFIIRCFPRNTGGSHRCGQHEHRLVRNGNVCGIRFARLHVGAVAGKRPQREHRLARYGFAVCIFVLNLVVHAFGLNGIPSHAQSSCVQNILHGCALPANEQAHAKLLRCAAALNGERHVVVLGVFRGRIALDALEVRNGAVIGKVDGIRSGERLHARIHKRKGNALLIKVNALAGQVIHHRITRRDRIGVLHLECPNRTTLHLRAKGGKRILIHLRGGQQLHGEGSSSRCIALCGGCRKRVRCSARRGVRKGAIGRNRAFVRLAYSRDCPADSRILCACSRKNKRCCLIRLQRIRAIGASGQIDGFAIGYRLKLECRNSRRNIFRILVVVFLATLPCKHGEAVVDGVGVNAPCRAVRTVQRTHKRVDLHLVSGFRLSALVGCTAAVQVVTVRRRSHAIQHAHKGARSSVFRHRARVVAVHNGAAAA